VQRVGSAFRRGALGLVTAIGLGSASVGVVTAQALSDPVIVRALVTPGSLPASGGTVTIVVEAIDDVGVVAASASLYSSDGSVDGVDLAAVGPTTFSGTYVVPANFGSDPVQWTVEVWVSDGDGGSASEFPGGIEVEPMPAFDEAPLLWDLTLEPASLPALGGPVVIAARAWDLRGISGATATVTAADGTASSLELQPVDAPDRFEGIFVAPPSSGTAATTYQVTVAVQDDIGQETRAAAGAVTVAGQAPSVPGTLAMSPRLVVVGPVPPGGTARATVLVRNTSPAGAAPVTATASVSGRGFRLVGDRTFTSAPGEVTAVRVEFSGSRRGVAAGALRIVRADGRQSRLGVVLAGVVLPRRR
jgi:hypothetical protein